MSCKSIYNSYFTERIHRLGVGGGGVVSRMSVVATLLTVFSFSSIFSQQGDEKIIPLERLVYPETQLCLLDVQCGQAVIDPFNIEDFNCDLLSLLRSADYLTVKTQAEVKKILTRNHAAAPEVYDPKALARICEMTYSDYAAFMRLISCEIDRRSGFSIPILFHQNKVTYRAELDVALVEGKTGFLQYSQRVIGEKILGRGMQVFPVTYDDPSLYLGFPQRERLARLAMQDLAQGAFEALIKGMHKPLREKYICYWQNEVHIISDKPGLCPICGSRLVKLVR